MEQERKCKRQLRGESERLGVIKQRSQMKKMNLGRLCTLHSRQKNA